MKISGKTDMSDVDLIIHIIASVPEEYEVAVSDLEDRLTSGADKIDIEIVREKLSARFDRLKKNDVKDAVNETALSALGVLLEDEDLHPDELAAFVKQFKGRCNKCGTYGHKAATCPTVKNDGGDPGGSCCCCCCRCGLAAPSPLLNSEHDEDDRSLSS